MCTFSLLDFPFIYVHVRRLVVSCLNVCLYIFFALKLFVSVCNKILYKLFVVGQTPGSAHVLLRLTPNGICEVNQARIRSFEREREREKGLFNKLSISSMFALLERKNR